jgi:glycosyltransferase involved in cell wall biosynthesis
MKIALVYDLIYPFSIGGVESRNFSLGKELVLQGHEVHLFGVKMWRGKDILKISKNYYAHGVSRYSGKYNFKGNRKAFEPLKYSFFLFFEMMKYDFDIVDVSAFPYFPAFSCKFYSLFKNRPLVITWHEAWGEFWKNYGLVGFFGRMVEKICTGLSKNNIAVSAATGQKLRKLGLKKCNVIENWIDLSEIREAKKSVVGYDLISIGRHLKLKNFDVVLKTIALLKKDFPDIRALMIGVGPETINLLRISKALGLEKNVDILGFTKEKSQMYGYLKSSKIFFLPSVLEGFSIVAFEAMACGLPVITLYSDRNALATYIKEGSTGYVCSKSEIEFALRIKGLLEDGEKLKEMSGCAVKFAANFDSRERTKEILGLYSRLTA